MRLCAFDVETAGTLQEFALQPYRATRGHGHITCAAFVYDNKSVSAPAGPPCSGPLSISQIKEHLEYCAENDITLVAWNTPFDAAWLIASGLRDEVFKCKWLDAMLLWKHTRQQPTYMPDAMNYSLKTAVAHYFPEHADYAEDILFDDMSPEGLRRLYKYNKDDAVFTLNLARIFIKSLRGRFPLLRIEAACIPMIADTMVRGLDVDTEKAKALKEKLERTSTAALVQLRLGDSDVTEKVLSSPKQLGDLLFDTWGLTPWSFTATGAYSTDKETLKNLARTDNRANLIYTYKEAKNNATKFAEGALKSAEYNEDNKTRPQFRIYGTYTGRGTYSSKQGRGKAERPTGIAIHQWKRDKEFRQLIKPPNGYKMVEFDFAGQEFRWMAVVSQDPTMMDLCQPGQDAHRYMASRIFSKPEHEVTKEERQLGKVANLSLQYRTGAIRLKTLAYTNFDIDIEQSLANAIHGTYQITYRGVPTYWRRQVQKCHIDEFIENLVGRRVYMPFSERDNTKQWATESTAINFPVQSMGADQKYLAMAVLRNAMPKYNARLMFELHDGIFLAIPNDKADAALHGLGKKLSTLPFYRTFGLDLPIDFPVDAKIGDSWGDLEETDIDFDYKAR